MKNMTHRLALGLLPFALGGMLTGCTAPDAEGRFNEFGDQTAEDRRIPDLGTPDGGQQIDFSGTYFLALKTLIAPTSPLYIEMAVEVDDAFNATFTMQPLKTDVVLPDKTPRADARTATGDPVVVSDVPINEDGSYTVEVLDWEVNGDANPISGARIVTDITFNGTVLSETSHCGTAGGAVKEPTALPLAGSTYGTVFADGQAYTDIMPLVDCTGAGTNNGTTNNGTTNNGTTNNGTVDMGAMDMGATDMAATDMGAMDMATD